MPAVDLSARTPADLAADTLKTLAMDAVQAANSGHPGMPMGMADAASVLWREALTVDPSAPAWADRDRFVLSAGHGSMLIYGLLHLSGHALPLEELRRFRQLHSKTPGHPEVGVTVGVETTTGPLGQGFANAVGMAMAERYLAARFNRDGFAVVDHKTFAIVSDGDLQEGITHEAGSLAGHLGLGKLVFLYDDNGIQIEGSTNLTFTEDVTKRFEAYGWHVLDVDGHDKAAVSAALEAGVAEAERPTLIRCRTHIGHMSPNKQDKASSHGSPLGHDEIAATKAAMGWPAEPTFLVPEGAVAAFDGLRARGADKRAAWQTMFEGYRSAHPELAAEFQRVVLDEGAGLPEGLAEALPSFEGAGSQATRASSGKVLNALAPHLPTLWGGSADLAGSNKTNVSGGASFLKDTPGGRNLHYGVREHGMSAIMNGMALHGGIVPYGGTFLTFSDYMRGGMRLSALMEQRVVYVLTHDSIFLGEDGPTHQAVEHAEALRLIPGLDVWRPADGRETAAAWLAALERHDGPSCLLLTRQGLPQVPGSQAALRADVRAAGAYVVRDGGTAPQMVMMATGSELHLCLEAAETLAADGVEVRVVSVPNRERFMALDAAERDAILPPTVPVRLAVEAGRTNGWQALVGPLGAVVGIDRFGESAPAEELAEFFGITTANVLQTARAVVSGARESAAREIARLQALAG